MGICEFYQIKAAQAVEEWDGQDDLELVRLLYEKLGSDLWGWVIQEQEELQALHDITD